MSDHADDTYISFDDAATVLRQELNYPEDRALHFVRLFDHNGDGRLSAAEFTQFRKKVEETPVDYAIWGKLQERVYCTRIRDVDHLVKRFVEDWSIFDHTSPMLQLLRGKLVCVRVGGGHAGQRTKKLLQETFSRFDVDCNGFLTLDEASTILRDEPFRFPPDKVVRLLKRFDKDGNGKLDYCEFAGFYAEAKASNDEISTRFKQLDKDGNGMLSQDEVSLVLQQLMGFDKSMALYLIDMFDTNHDGHLDKTEFIQMWSGMFGR